MSADARRYLTAVVLLVLLAGTAEAVRVTRVRPTMYHPTFEDVPHQIGAYTGTDLPRDESIYRFLSAEGMLERKYAGPGPDVYMTILYAPDWRSIHSPEGCYPSQGWMVLEEKVVTVASPARPLEAKFLRLKKDKLNLMALYSFAYLGGTTADWEKEGYRVALGPRGAGGVVFALSTAIDASGSSAAADRLIPIMQVAYPAALSFWKKK
jgi:hypothetical protein